MSDPYTTLLNDRDELRFQVWRSLLPENLQSDQDYDLRGAFKDGLKPSENEHFGDKYKKPNHITFSDESMYSTPEIMGGRWVGDDSGGVFWASDANLIHYSPEQLQEYFARSEPGWQVIMPSSYGVNLK